MDADLEFLRDGGHMEIDSEVDPWGDVPKEGPGSSREEPFTVTPDDREIPYGSWCKCGVCGGVGRSTFAFDFYMEETGGPLKCEVCQMPQS